MEMVEKRDAAVDLRTCAEELLYALHIHGVDHLFLNPGTDSAPLQEAVAALSGRGIPIPRIVASSFESVALAAAHGYWQTMRRPQAVFVHVDVGTQNLGAMVHNVLRDQAGVVVLAGKAPYSEDPLSPGARSNPVHWHQDVPDQIGILRGYAKWSAELTRSADTSRLIGRAVQVAAGAIPGLAYVTLSRDVLMEPAAGARLRRAGRFARPAPPAMAPDALADMAHLLLHAELPVIIADRVGRRAEGARALGRLADLAAIPVVGHSNVVNISTAHPMCVRSAGKAASLISEADFLLIVDCDVPWVPGTTVPSPNATVAQIDVDPVKANMPLWSFPVDLAATADSAVALDQLFEVLSAAGNGAKNRWAARRKALAAVIAEAATTEAAIADENRKADGVEKLISVRDVLRTLNDVLEPTDIVLDEAVSHHNVVAELLERTEAGTLCTSGGPGLGWALGACVGVKLANPGRRVVAIVGDGAFMFGVPTSALCLAAEANTAFVVVVLNNDGYRASRLPVYGLFPEGASVAEGRVVATSFAHPPDFVAVAKACGAFAERVCHQSRLPVVLAEALRAASGGQVAVVDVQVTDR